MKIFGFKSVLAMLTFSVMSLFFQSLTQAQVNKQLLSDVIKSCQRDMSIDYFKKMGISIDTNYYARVNFEPSSEIQSSCIARRYFYESVIEKLPWLPDSGEIAPNFPASVALSKVIFNINQELYRYRLVDVNDVLECFTGKDFNGERECSWITLIYGGYRSPYKYSSIDYYKIVGGAGNGDYNSNFLPYICTKCVVAHDAAYGSATLNIGFINWFLSLDKSKRRDVVSVLTSKEILKDLRSKYDEALSAYEEALQKIERDNQEQRRRDLLGQ